MTALRQHSPVTAPVAAACTVALGLTSMPTSAFMVGAQRLIADVELVAGAGFIMGGTGNPEPDPVYQGDVASLYLQPTSPLFSGQPVFDTYSFQGLSTPEQACPTACLPPPNPQLNLVDSLTQGQTQLTNALVPHLQAGENVAVLGYSQSAVLATQVMNSLISNPAGAGLTTGELNNLHVVLLGDPNSPVGGVLDRFQFPDSSHAFGSNPAPQILPFAGIPLSIPPTPTDTVPTVIYTGEYDGYANFPQDQLNFLGGINAMIGIQTVHSFYPSYTPEQVAAAIDIGTIGDTNFYIIPQNLPILQLVYAEGPAGQALGDFLSPWARLFIDWGYGNAGDPAVDGLYPIPAGPGISGGSPFQQDFGVAGGPWAETPLGELYGSDGTLPAGTDVAGFGIAGFFEKMDPLQMLAGLDNAFIQSIVGPWVDAEVAAGGPLSPSEIDTINGVIDTLQNITGYTLINSIDHALLTAWNDAANAMGLGDVIGPDAVLDGPLIPGQGLIDLTGAAFDVFHSFGP